MHDNWTDVQRLAARVLASGSDEALRDLLAELDKGPPPIGKPAPDPSRRFGRVRSRRADRKPRRSSSRSRRDGAEVLNRAVDGIVVLAALASIAIGTRPLATSMADARPAITDALADAALPGALIEEPDAGLVSMRSVERPVARGEPVPQLARSLEASIGRYRAVADMHAQRKLSCAQLRSSYLEVEKAWMTYSVARGRTYGDRLPDRLIGWDTALYDAVRDVDRTFTAAGCNRP